MIFDVKMMKKHVCWKVEKVEKIKKYDKVNKTLKITSQKSQNFVKIMKQARCNYILLGVAALEKSVFEK